MTYEEALGTIHGLLRFGSKPGLSRVAELLRRMSDPQDTLSFVHVAGTNGKGSTCAAVAGALAAAGYTTGLYISPYISDFCERMSINGRMISHDALAREMEKLLPHMRQMAAEGRQPTEFEVVTALAFSWFREAGCDVVVLEVGLGGRFDATNVIKTPLVSVITSISLDHMEILGDTLAKIAFEKCGIIKDGGITVSAPGQDPEALAVIMRSCAEHENTLRIPNDRSVSVLEESIEGTRVRFGERELFIPLCGRHQIANFLTACEVVDALRGRGFAVSDEDRARGMAGVRFPARMEILHKNPLIVLDGAHNPAGAAVLAAAVRRCLAGRPVTVVMGALADKDHEAMVARIAPLARRFAAVRPDSPRALAPESLAREAARCCEETRCFAQYGDALTYALQNLRAEEAVVICGSLYLAGPMRLAVEKRYGQLYGAHGGA